MTEKDITPLSYTRPSEAGTEGKTNPLAREIIQAVARWAEQFDNEEAKTLVTAMNDLDELMISCWTEVDESLTFLLLAQQHLSRGRTEETAKHVDVARRYLNRWQGREGMCGNASVYVAPKVIDRPIKTILIE